MIISTAQFGARRIFSAVNKRIPHLLRLLLPFACVSGGLENARAGTEQRGTWFVGWLTGWKMNNSTLRDDDTVSSSLIELIGEY